MDDRVGDFTGDVLVADGKIKKVAPRIDGGDAEIVDAADHLILPGLVDSHRHTWQSPIRHTGLDWDLPRMFVELFKRFGPHFRPEDVYAATLFGRLAALDAGVTTLLDWAHIQNSPSHADEAIRALREAGGRTIYAHGQPGIEPERWMKESTLPHPADIRRLREQVLSSDDALVTLAMAARGPEFTTIETTEHDLRLARELGLRITIHIGLGANGPKYRGVERMHQRKLLGPDVTFVHCCNCSDHEFHLMAETGTTACVSAQIASTCGGFGLPATGKLMAHGVRPGLSVDSEMSASGDLFSEMRAALNMERALTMNDLQSRPRPVSITARDVLGFATIEGARTVGLDKQDRQHHARKIRRPHPDPAPCAQPGADGRSDCGVGARRPCRQRRSRHRRRSPREVERPHARLRSAPRHRAARSIPRIPLREGGRARPRRLVIPPCPFKPSRPLESENGTSQSG